MAVRSKLEKRQYRTALRELRYQWMLAGRSGTELCMPDIQRMEQNDGTEAQ